MTCKLAPGRLDWLPPTCLCSTPGEPVCALTRKQWDIAKDAPGIYCKDGSIAYARSKKADPDEPPMRACHCLAMTFCDGITPDFWIMSQGQQDAAYRRAAVENNRQDHPAIFAKTFATADYNKIHRSGETRPLL